MHQRAPLLISIALFSVSSLALAQTYQLTAPSAPVGIYDKIRLVPQASTPPCYEGTLYLKTGDISPSLCIQNGSTWGYMSGVWTQLNQSSPLHQHFVYVPSPPANLKLHIGGALTAPDLTNIPKLTLDDFYATTRTTQDGGILAMGNSQNIQIPAGGFSGPSALFLWYPHKAALWAGNIASGSTLIDGNIGQYSVSFGSTSYASGQASTVSGGLWNIASGNSSTIGGGANNSTQADYAAIAGGFGNTANGSTAFIGGGQSNIATGIASVVIGGRGNLAFGNTSAIGGGKNNENYSDYGTILGGNSNIIAPLTRNGSGNPTSYCQYGTIGGGWDNHLGVPDGNNRLIKCGHGDFIGGGEQNAISSSPNNNNNGYNAIGSGGQNTAFDSAYSVIVGGWGNQMYHNLFSFIGGGTWNRLGDQGYTGSSFSQYNVIGGGADNLIWPGGNDRKSEFNFIGGGNCNKTCADYVTILGGNHYNDGFIVYPVDPGALPTCYGDSYCEGNYSFTGGGRNNFAAGEYSVVLGGDGNLTGKVIGVDSWNHNNVVDGSAYSWAGGRNMVVTGDRTFVWGYHTTRDMEDIDVSANDAFIIFPRGEGKVGIGVNNPGGSYNSYTSNAMLDISSSDIALKMQGPGSAPWNSTLIIETPPATSVGCPLAKSNLDWHWGYKDSNPNCSPNDLAEIFTAAQAVSPGDVLVIDPQGTRQAQKSSKPYDPRVVGVVSEMPAILLEGTSTHLSPGKNIATPTRPAVALAGRVLCKITLENGPVEYGDLLTSSSTPGYAMKATDSKKSFGAVIGKALEPFAGGPAGEKEGFIAILVSLQ